jgi:hypothetical protein
MSYRKNESLVSKQQAKQCVSAVYCWWKMSDNLEQRINMKICVKVGEYALKESSVLEWHRQFKDGREDVQDDSRSGLPKT